MLKTTAITSHMFCCTRF